MLWFNLKYSDCKKINLIIENYWYAHYYISVWNIYLSANSATIIGYVKFKYGL